MLFSDLPANEGGGERCHRVYYFACKTHFQASDALTGESKMSIFPVKRDCCNLAHMYSSLKHSACSGIYSLGSLKAIEQRVFLIYHNYTNTCAEQPCTELLGIFSGVQQCSTLLSCDLMV